VGGACHGVRNFMHAVVDLIEYLYDLFDAAVPEALVVKHLVAEDKPETIRCANIAGPKLALRIFKRRAKQEKPNFTREEFVEWVSCVLQRVAATTN